MEHVILNGTNVRFTDVNNKLAAKILDKLNYNADIVNSPNYIEMTFSDFLNKGLEVKNVIESYSFPKTKYNVEKDGMVYFDSIGQLANFLQTVPEYWIAFIHSNGRNHYISLKCHIHVEVNANKELQVFTQDQRYILSPSLV